MLYQLSTNSWNEPIARTDQQNALAAIEKGQVLYLPYLSFNLNLAEQTLLSPEVLLKGGPKNVSFNPSTGKLKGASPAGENIARLIALMSRFADHSLNLLHLILPEYQGVLIEGRTSYRPVEVAGRKSSLLKDDTRLHVDAFPATPNHGKRILRVFSNINPNGKGRLWHLGEPFEAVVEQFKSKLKSPRFGTRKLLSMFEITKSYRSLYDHYMLMLHDQMKINNQYQRQVQKIPIDFAAGSTWIVMTDHVSHAALSGQYLLEQTFYLPVENMQNPEKSPLCILERVLGKKLIDLKK